MLKRVRIILTVLLLLATVGVDAQVTTASMAGKVTDASNEPIIGATVQAVHQPSGSRYGTVTNVDGRYSIQGMRTGGPGWRFPTSAIRRLFIRTSPFSWVRYTT